MTSSRCLGIVQAQDPLGFVGPAVPVAAAALAVIDIVVFLVAQRWIVAGLTRSGIKG